MRLSHGQESQTLRERIETLSDPGAEKARQSHTGRTAFGATCATTDFASDDEGAHTAFGQIVIGRHTGISHEDKEFGQKTLDPFAERMHDGLRPDKRRTDLPQLLLE